MSDVEQDDKVYTGEVIFFSKTKNYGFIKQEDDKADLFVHFSDLNMLGYKTLEKNQIVSYTVGVNHRGQPKATNVTVIGTAAQSKK